MKTIAFFNNKGGVGKSTSVINVAYALAKLGKRILVVDCDSQQNTFRFFSDTGDAENINSTRYENIDILYNPDKPDNAVIDYDYQILDMPPALTDTAVLILSKCDYVFVPIELGTFAIQGIANVTDSIAATGAKFGGCFISKFDRKNPADHELAEMLRGTLGNLAMTSRVPYSRVIKNSISYRMTAFEYMEWTDAARMYTMLTQEILAICGKKQKENKNKTGVTKNG